MTGRAVASYPRPLSNRPLTAKQLDVLIRVANGQTQNEIARAAGVRRDTVAGTMHEIFRKLGGARTRAQAVDVAYQRGVLEVRPDPSVVGAWPAPLVQVLELVASGCTNAEIAHRLERSEHTVADQVKEARRRLGARDRAHAAALAVAMRIVQVQLPALQPATVNAA